MRLMRAAAFGDHGWYVHKDGKRYKIRGRVELA